MAPTMAEIDHGKFDAPTLSAGALPFEVAVGLSSSPLVVEVGDVPRGPLALLERCSPALPVSFDVSPVAVSSAGATERLPKAPIAAVSVGSPADALAVLPTGTARPRLSVVNETVIPLTTTADPVGVSEYVVPSTVMGDPPATRGVLSMTKVGDALDPAFPFESPIVVEPC
jgi:hypothetical protein